MALIPNNGATITVPAGTRFRVKGVRSARTCADSRWDIVVGDATNGTLRGTRFIDGSRCAIIQVAPGEFIAVTVVFMGWVR